MGTLSELVTTEIGNFFKGNPRQIFHNELDFQVQLAHHLLQSGHFTNVFMEYYVPKGCVSNYPWNSQIYIDIVVERDSEFYLIELKYKTKAIEKATYTCFNEELPGMPLLKNHGAEHDNRYAFWKDVKRIEYVQKRFSSIIGGVAIFLTNNDKYSKKVSQGCDDADFSMHPEDPLHHIKKWKNEEPKLDKNGRSKPIDPPIELQKNYKPQWPTVDMSAGCNSSADFHYCMVEV